MGVHRLREKTPRKSTGLEGLNSAKHLGEGVFKLRTQQLLNCSYKLSKTATMTDEMKLKRAYDWKHQTTAASSAQKQTLCWITMESADKVRPAVTEDYVHISTAGSFCIACYVFFLDVLSFKYLAQIYTQFLESSCSSREKTSGNWKQWLGPKTNFSFINIQL